MDEVENPDLPAAGEASPTLRPIEEDENDSSSPTKPSLDTAEAENLLSNGDLNTEAYPTLLNLPSRPGLQRESSVPPPQQPPPAPPDNNGNNDFPQDPPDSLTLADLRRIRSTFPNAQPTLRKERLEKEDYAHIYDFEYADTQSLPVEIEEWFSYSEEEKERLRRCREAFCEEWKASEEGQEGKTWLDVTEDVRRAFVGKRIACLAENNGGQDGKATALMILTYLALGVWEETAGKQESGTLLDLFPGSDKPGSRLDEYETSSLQLQWMVSMVDTLHACDGLQVIYGTLRNTCETDFKMGFAVDEYETMPSRQPTESMEMWCSLTLLYLFIEVARTTQGQQTQQLKKDIASLEPSLLNYFTQTIARLRWEENLPIPLTKLLLLSWKTILVTIGSLTDLSLAKTELQEPEQEHDTRGQPLITASPLDYHLFRQEISSKYPAYQPPPPLFPLEPENNSILPPLKHRSLSTTTSLSQTTVPSFTSTESIMHAPVHIATPAPSPPPSPGGPGKAGKKQNYQTNQMFPFLYPPLDGRSNDLGGKGSTEYQDLWVGRKWEGGDVPRSIEEAGELFRERMRGTRGMRQLWGVREGFMREERGWRDGGGEKEGGEEGKRGKEAQPEISWEEVRKMHGLEGLELDVSDSEEEEEDGKVDEERSDENKPTEEKADDEDFELLSPCLPNETAEQGQPLHPQSSTQRRLDAAEKFYRDSLPHMQSIVIVLLKAVLNNVTDMVTKSSNGQNGVGLQAGIQFPNEVNGISNSARPIENGTSDGIENTAEELDKLRSQEIAAKALSAILLLLLKWFKLSHILQFEYLTQLLLDSNYVPLILKLWQTQEIGRACHFRLGEEEREFFWWCGEDSRRHQQQEQQAMAVHEEEDSTAGNPCANTESSDEALPPPIKLKRSPPPSSSAAVEGPGSNPLSPVSGADFHPHSQHPPEVDELGYPLTPLPSIPIKTGSWRQIFTLTNYLRILQKLTRRKTHRSLMLVQYKSSQHLKKTLRIPIHLLRYYTLKLFKSQVPFCGRKWRQGNMKIITAVYLAISPELRDDWLSGGGGGMGGGGVLGDVDGTVEDALPLEQSLRSLTHWWNVKHYPEMMGRGKGVPGGGLEEEEGVGFFERELGRMGLMGAEEQGVGEEGERVEDGGGGFLGALDGY